MRLVARRTVRSVAACWPSRCRSTPAPARRSTARRRPPPGKTPELRVPTWTKIDARQRRGPHRLGEARSAARVVLASRSSAAPNQFEPAERTRRREPHRGDDERRHEDARRRSAVERAAAARHVGVDGDRRRERLDQLRVARRQVRSRRWTSSPTCCSTRRSRPKRSSGCARSGSSRSTQAKAQPGAIAGARVSARALRRRASVRPRRRPRSRSRRSRATTSSRSTRQYFQPGRALITVVGDVTAAA